LRFRWKSIPRGEEPAWPRLRAAALRALRVALRMQVLRTRSVDWAG
jgi:hypothetical protein